MYISEQINCLLFPKLLITLHLETIMKNLSLIVILLLFVSSAFANKTPLTLKVYSADSHSFYVNSTLIYGETEAVVIDAGFTKADALRIAANVLDSGKELTTIFVSQADPDYYFGVTELKKIFPAVKVIATPTVRQVIKKKMMAKLAYWGPKMKLNSPDKLVLPDAYLKDSFSVDGFDIEIKGNKGLLAHRPYLWIPSSKAIVGNVGISGGLHVWTADVQQQSIWNVWLDQLHTMKNLKPKIVVPGHMKAGTALSDKTISYTIEYLKVFEKAKANSKNSTELINTMKQAYPNAQLPSSLTIGAKVHMGEMKW